MFEPTPKNSTIDGQRWPKNPESYIHWDQMDWSKKVWREKSTLMVALVGQEKSPDDPHWNVPHVNGETWHRVRPK